MSQRDMDELFESVVYLPGSVRPDWRTVSDTDEDDEGDDVKKYNPNHDPKNGRFTTGSGGGGTPQLALASGGGRDPELVQVPAGMGLHTFIRRETMKEAAKVGIDQETAKNIYRSGYEFGRNARKFDSDPDSSDEFNLDDALDMVAGDFFPNGPSEAAAGAVYELIGAGYDAGFTGVRLRKYNPNDDHTRRRNRSVSKTRVDLSVGGSRSDDDASTEIMKIDEDKRLVWGWASVISKDGEPIIDFQGDIIDADELVLAAHDFMENHRVGGQMHKKMGTGVVVESMCFTAELQKALGIDLGMEGWLIGVKVSDDECWAGVKSGKFRSFSIGGSGERHPVVAKFNPNHDPKNGRFSSGSGGSASSGGEAKGGKKTSATSAQRSPAARSTDAMFALIRQLRKDPATKDQPAETMAELRSHLDNGSSLKDYIESVTIQPKTQQLINEWVKATREYEGYEDE